MEKKKVALYAGTFDPVTNGHLDIIRRGVKLFDSLIVAVSENPRKSPLFTVQERVQLLLESIGAIDRVKVIPFHCLLVDLARQNNAATIIRGIRAVSDFEIELQMALTNRRLAPDIETVYLLPSEEHTFISSSLIKEVSSFGGDISTMVPAHVLNALKARLGK